MYFMMEKGKKGLDVFLENSIVVLVLVFSLLFISVYFDNGGMTGHVIAGGTGIESDPYVVDSCGSLDQQGYYVLGKDINASGNCLVINNNSIVLDGKGYNITGASSGNGISLSGRTNVTLKNLSVYNFTYGISLSSSNNNTFFNIQSLKNQYGLSLTLSSNNTFSLLNFSLNSQNWSIDSGSMNDYIDGFLFTRGTISGNQIPFCGDITQPGTYFLSGNISNPGAFNCINILSDNVTLQGNNYSLVGSRSGIGISLTKRSNITLSNITIRNFLVGISLSSSSGIFISHVEVSDANCRPYYPYYCSPFPIGISLSYTNNTVFYNIKSSNNEYGINLASSSYNNFSLVNLSLNNKNLVIDSGSLNDYLEGVLVTRGIITGNQITFCGDITQPGTYFLSTNISNPTVFNCINILSDNVNLQGNNYSIGGLNSGIGISLTKRSNITISNIKINNFSTGISLSSSSNNTFFNIQSLKNQYGISLASNSNSNILSNISSWNNQYGISLASSSYNNFSLISFSSNSQNWSTDSSSYNNYLDGILFTRGVLAGSEITSCTDITRPGTFFISSNLTSSSSICINILSDNVTLDGQGFKITGSGSGTGMVLSHRKNVTVLNLQFFNFGTGLSITSSSYGNNFSNITLAFNSQNISVSEDSLNNYLNNLLIGRKGYVDQYFIDVCGDLLSPGQYTLQNNINTAFSTCLKISVANVTLDGGNYNITGANTGTGLIISNGMNITVKNLNFDKFSISISASNSQNINISNSISFHNYCYHPYGEGCQTYALYLSSIINSSFSSIHSWDSSAPFYSFWQDSSSTALAYVYSSSNNYFNNLLLNSNYCYRTYYRYADIPCFLSGITLSSSSDNSFYNVSFPSGSPWVFDDSSINNQLDGVFFTRGTLLGNQLNSCVDITVPGTYSFSSKVFYLGSSTCIRVLSDNVTLDGNNYGIFGVNLGTAISLIGVKNVSLKNFKISNFSTGITLGSSSNNSFSNILFENVQRQGSSDDASLHNSLDGKIVSKDSITGNVISSCVNINFSGNYFLSSNISYWGSSNCINILKDNVTLDGKYFYLKGSDSGIGILISNVRNVTIQNFNVNNFTTGINLASSNSYFSNISSKTFCLGGCSTYGVYSSAGLNNRFSNILTNNSCSGSCSSTSFYLGSNYNTSLNNLKSTSSCYNSGGGCSSYALTLSSGSNNVLNNFSYTSASGCYNAYSGACSSFGLFLASSSNNSVSNLNSFSVSCSGFWICSTPVQISLSSSSYNNFSSIAFSTGSTPWKIESNSYNNSLDDVSLLGTSLGTNITTCGVINQSGEYKIDKDLIHNTPADNCLVISADNVVLDGQNYHLSGLNRGTGIKIINQANITIKNLNISIFNVGVSLQSVSGANFLNANSMFNNENWQVDESCSDIYFNGNLGTRGIISSNIIENCGDITEGGSPGRSGNLILYYKLNDNSADNVVVDSSGNGYGGTAQQNTEDTYVGSGNPPNLNGAMNFDGSNGIDTSLNGLNTWDELTISVWINTSVDDNGDWATIATQEGADSAGQFLISRNADNGVGKIYWAWGGGLFSNNVVNDGNWHLVTVEYSLSQQFTKIYIDGILDNSGEVSSLGGEGSDFMTLGYETNVGRYLNGVLDDFRVYNYALNDSQISDLYNEGLGIETLGPSLYEAPLNKVYTLSKDILYFGTSNCLNVLADNVVIDGQGYSISGSGSAKGINVDSRKNVVIKNANVKSFNTGINIRSSQDISLLDSSTIGNQYDGVYTSGTDHLVINNLETHFNFGDDGVWFSYGSNNVLVENVNAYCNGYDSMTDNYNFGYAGIEFEGTNLTMKNVDIKSGSYYGLAFWDLYDSHVDNVHVDGNLFYEQLDWGSYAKEPLGMYVYGNNNNFDHITLENSNGTGLLIEDAGNNVRGFSGVTVNNTFNNLLVRNHAYSNVVKWYNESTANNVINYGSGYSGDIKNIDCATLWNEYVSTGVIDPSTITVGNPTGNTGSGGGSGGSGGSGGGGGGSPKKLNASLPLNNGSVGGNGNNGVEVNASKGTNGTGIIPISLTDEQKSNLSKALIIGLSIGVIFIGALILVVLFYGSKRKENNLEEIRPKKIVEEQKAIEKKPSMLEKFRAWNARRKKENEKRREEREMERKRKEAQKERARIIELKEQQKLEEARKRQQEIEEKRRLEEQKIDEAKRKQQEIEEKKRQQELAKQQAKLAAAQAKMVSMPKTQNDALKSKIEVLLMQGKTYIDLKMNNKAREVYEEIHRIYNQLEKADDDLFAQIMDYYKKLK
jgi:hypothetical protein